MRPSSSEKYGWPCWVMAFAGAKMITCMLPPHHYSFASPRDFLSFYHIHSSVPLLFKNQNADFAPNLHRLQGELPLSPIFISSIPISINKSCQLLHFSYNSSQNLKFHAYRRSLHFERMLHCDSIFRPYYLILEIDHHNRLDTNQYSQL